MVSQARVLVVEGDPRIGSWVQVALRAAGYEVTWAVTGTAAIQAVARQPIDVVLLDLGLPDGDGLDVCRVLRRERPDAVIVILTASGEDIDVISGLESGADDYVTKPFGMTVLLARIEAHLRSCTSMGAGRRAPEWATVAPCRPPRGRSDRFDAGPVGANPRPRNGCVASGCGSCVVPGPFVRGCRPGRGLRR